MSEHDARAEAVRLYPDARDHYWGKGAAVNHRNAFYEGAEWARAAVLAEVRAEIGELTNIVGHHFVITDSEDGDVYGGYAMHTDEQARAILFAMLDRVEGA